MHLATATSATLLSSFCILIAFVSIGVSLTFPLIMVRDGYLGTIDAAEGFALLGGFFTGLIMATVSIGFVYTLKNAIESSDVARMYPPATNE